MRNEHEGYEGHVEMKRDIVLQRYSNGREQIKVKLPQDDRWIFDADRAMQVAPMHHGHQFLLLPFMLLDDPSNDPSVEQAIAVQQADRRDRTYDHRRYRAGQVPIIHSH